MSSVFDIIIILVFIFGFIIGLKEGLIKSLVSFVGFIVITIISYSLKDTVTTFLIDHLPFIEFGGLNSISILVYNAISFLAIFLILYCILNIILTVTGVIDKILKLTVIWIIPSKIGGAIIGLLETWLLLFVSLFVMTHFNVTNDLIKESKLSNIILDYTPFLHNYLDDAKNGAEEIYNSIDEFNKNNQNKSKEELNMDILKLEIKYNLISEEKANELIETGKVNVKKMGDSE